MKLQAIQNYYTANAGSSLEDTQAKTSNPNFTFNINKTK